MAVRKGPRMRYVLFRISAGSPVERGDVIGALTSVIRARRPELAASARERFFVVLVQDGWGILKCPVKDRAAACELLNAIDSLGRPGAPARVATVATSGTILTLKLRAGLPTNRPKPRPAEIAPARQGGRPRAAAK